MPKIKNLQTLEIVGQDNYLTWGAFHEKKEKRKLNEIEGCKKDQLSHISLLLVFTAMTHLELRKIPKWPGMDTQLRKIET